MELVVKDEEQAHPALRQQRQWQGGLGTWAERGLVQMETRTADTVDGRGWAKNGFQMEGFQQGRDTVDCFLAQQWRQRGGALKDKRFQAFGERLATDTGVPLLQGPELPEKEGQEPFREKNEPLLPPADVSPCCMVNLD